VDDQPKTRGSVVWPPKAAPESCQWYAGSQGPRPPAFTQERAAVVDMATLPAYADLSHRVLAVTAWDLGFFFVSFSSVYRILCSEGLMSLRATTVITTAVTAPGTKRDQRSQPALVLDISYLPTYERGVFCICTCCSTSSLARRSTGWSAGTNAPRRPESFWKPLASREHPATSRAQATRDFQ